MSDNGNRLTEESLNNDHIEENIDLSELGELSELRSLLLGIEQPKLHRFYEKLENPQVDAEDISKMLPEAVILRTMQDEHLSEAMVPSIEQAIESSIKKDLNILTQAIFPIMGPAMRKAIATAMDEMLQSLNQTLEHSVSPESLKWRIEARQTGKSFAEVVMLRTLIYRVEQVFLIHKHSGLILQHIVAPMVTSQDPSLVSAMLSAIQDFVKDSFEVQKHEGLHTLEFGELTIWIEEGPTSVLAGIIRGNAPEELRFIFKNTLEKIHLKLSREIKAFSGDTEPFEASKPYLETCLEFRYGTPAKKNNYTYAWVVLGILTMGLGVWGFFTIRENNRWNTYLQSLDAQPGIVVTKANKRNGKYFIAGMRDPLAVEPDRLIEQANLNPKKVVNQWKPFVSLEPQITIKRAAQLLQKPETVTFQLEQNGVLKATGSASRKWILSAKERAASLSFLGITKYQDDITDLDIDQLNAYKKEIEQVIVLFEKGTTEFLPGESEKVVKLVPKLRKLIDAGKFLKKDVLIEIAGHADSAGDKQANIKLSQVRAKIILTYLASVGIDRNKFSTKALGSEEILRPGSTQPNEKFNRRVSFKVIIDDIAK